MPVPLISIDKLDGLDRSKRPTNSRKIVSAYGNSILKTGESSLGTINRHYEHDTPKERSRRQERAFSEFRKSYKNADLGLPVVRPVCIVYSLSDNEYFLVEPLGTGLEDQMYGLKHFFPENGNELKLTLQSVGRFFAILRNMNMGYDSNVDFRKSDTEHMIRFEKDEVYEILLTDSPDFFGSNVPAKDNRNLEKVIQQLRSGNLPPSLAELIDTEFTMGFGEDISSVFPRTIRTA